MGSIFGLDKLFPQLFKNNTIIYAFVGLILIVAYFYFKKGETKTDMKVFYFAPVERLVQPLEVNKLSPKSVQTNDEKKFMRRAKSWLWRFKNQSFVFWLGKVGRGITYRLEQNKKDSEGNAQVEKIGSLLDGIRNCLQLDADGEIHQAIFDEDAISKLNTSEIFVCVDLEDDDSTMPKITEESATREADIAISDLVGMKIKQHLSKEDWIRNAGMMAIGALTYIIIGQLGLL